LHRLLGLATVETKGREPNPLIRKKVMAKIQSRPFSKAKRKLASAPFPRGKSKLS